MRKTYVTSYPSYSLLFERFIVGMHKMMGDKVHQDKAVTLEVVHKLIEGLEDEYGRASGDQVKENIVDMEVFILASFLAELRGEETMKLVLGEICDHLDESENRRTYKHVVLPLRGRFNGESGGKIHFVAVTTRTNSGLCIGSWVRRALDLKEKRNIIRCFFFVDNKGKKLALKDI